MKRRSRRHVEHVIVRAVLVGLLGLAITSCKSCKDDDEEEEREEREKALDHYWRAQIRIVGHGSVKTFIDAFDCTSDGRAQTGVCGPKLVKFKELSPATMQAIDAPGYRFDHWESETRAPDGATYARKGRMPDGRVYLNGFGYADTGELETVTAVFVAASDAGSDAGASR